MLSNEPIRPGEKLRDALLAAGWQKIGPCEPGAYERHGDRFLTWKKNGVTIASTGNAMCYSTERHYVELYDGYGETATVEVLITDPTLRRQGRAREALAEWTALAQAAELTLFLEPVPQEDGVDLLPLVKFYESLGFEFTCSARRVMHRQVLSPAAAKD